MHRAKLIFAKLRVVVYESFVHTRRWPLHSGQGSFVGSPPRARWLMVRLVPRKWRVIPEPLQASQVTQPKEGGVREDGIVCFQLKRE